MLSSITSIFLLVVAGLPESTAFDLHSVDGRLLRGHLQAKVAFASNDTRESLQALGQRCSCSFSGLCSCVQALEFMKCIRDACDSGACDCQKHHYFYACHSMTAECPNAGLKCGVKEANCKKVPPMVTESSLELVGDVEVMQERRCKLEQAVDKGWINGKVRVAELDPQIQDRTDALKSKGIEVPQLGCTEEDGASFHAFKTDLQEQMEREQAQAQAKAIERRTARKKKLVEKDAAEMSFRSPWNKKEVPSIQRNPDAQDFKLPVVAVPSAHVWWARPRNLLRLFLSVLVNIAIAFICAWIYNKFRFHPKLPVAPNIMAINSPAQVCSCGNVFAPDADYCRKCGERHAPEDNFGVGLFSCFSDMKLCVFACCCPCLRWADTVDRANLLKYWRAVAVFATLAILSPYTFGITGIVLALICFRYRMRLRKKHHVAPNNCEDGLAYLFCGTCAMVQEARVQAFRNSYTSDYGVTGTWQASDL